MKKLLTFIFSVSLLLALAFSGIVHTPAKALAATEGSVAVNGGYSGDQCFYYRTTFSGAITVEYDVAFKSYTKTVFGFGLTPDGTQSNPYSSGMFFANSQIIYTPWRPTGIAAETAYKNYNENYWGTNMYFRVRIKMEVNAAGDVTLYAKSIEPETSYGGSNAQVGEYVQITDTLNGHFASELGGESYMLGFFFRNGSEKNETMYFYGFKAVAGETVVEERFESENMTDKFWTGAIDGALSAGNIVYTQSAPAIQEKTSLKVTGVPIFENNDGYNLPYLYFMMNTSAKQWDIFIEQLANVEYKRADGSVETLNNVVVIDTEKVQVRLAAGGTWELRNGDVFTLKKGFTLINNENLIETLEDDVSFIYDAESDGFVSAEDYNADKRGAMVIMPDYVFDGMMNYNTRINGACNVYIDLDVSSLNAFGVGFMGYIGDSSPYSSKLFMMTATNVYTPWATSYMSAPTAYTNGFTMRATTIKITVNDGGDTCVYALDGENYVKIIDDISGMYKDEVNGGMYLSMFARTNSAKGYIYSIAVTDKNDKLLAKTDFAYDKLNADTFTFCGAVGEDFAGDGKMLSWQEPTGQYIPVPEVEILTGNVESVITEGSEINLTPTVNNMLDTDALSITLVDGEKEINIENGIYKFDNAGVYTVKYVVKDKDGIVKTSDDKTIIVNVPSTQPTAMTNFNQGWFDNRNFEATGKAGVSDGELLIKTDDKASFMTKGYSESFILTFDVTKYVSGEISVVLGKIRDNAYIITFNADGTLSLGEQSAVLPVNVYEILGKGKVVTVRVKLSAKTAEVYLRAEDTSVENIDVAVARFTDLQITGKVGVSAETASEFSIDNFGFVSLTSVKGENTGDPEPQPTPGESGDSGDSGNTSGDSTGSSDTGRTGCNCKGSIGIMPVIAIVVVTAAVALKKRKED